MKKEMFIFLVCFAGTIAVAYDNLEYKGAPRNSACYGQCYVDYVALNGTTVEIERKKQLLAQADEFSDIRSLWAGCAACHGQEGEGGIGPTLAGQSETDIITKLTTYKNGGMIGSQSALMWGQAAMLSENDIKTIGKFIQQGLPK
jgi:cytochrome c553|tara:strand:- start:560 stop:994 length:435 start_codon:yes stop_codon:yes gene_type:complete